MGQNLSMMMNQKKERKYYPLFNNGSLDFLKGILTGETKIYIKINGSCGMIKRKDYSSKWSLYERYDKSFEKSENKSYSNEDALLEGLIPLNEVGNPSRYGNNIKHNYFLREIPRSKTKETITPQKLINYSLYKILDSKEFSELKENEYSVEIVGNNLDGIHDVCRSNIAIHSDQEIKLIFDRKLNTACDWFMYFSNLFFVSRIEGLVFIKNNIAMKLLNHNFKYNCDIHDKNCEDPKKKERMIKMFGSDYFQRPHGTRVYYVTDSDEWNFILPKYNLADIDCETRDGVWMVICEPKKPEDVNESDFDPPKLRVNIITIPILKNSRKNKK